MARSHMNIGSTCTGLTELAISIKSIEDVLHASGADGALEIEGEGMAVTFEGAPLVDVRTETTVEPGRINIAIDVRPAAGLGLLVGAAAARCGEKLKVEWRSGWPIVGRHPVEKMAAETQPDRAPDPA